MVEVVCADVVESVAPERSSGIWVGDEVPDRSGEYLRVGVRSDLGCHNVGEIGRGTETCDDRRDPEAETVPDGSRDLAVGSPTQLDREVGPSKP